MLGNIKIKSVFKGLLVALLLITTVVMFLVDPSKYMNLGSMYTMGEFFENVACGCLVAFLTWKFLFKRKKSSGMYTFASVLLALNFLRIFWPTHETSQDTPEQKGWALFHQQITAIHHGEHISPQSFSTKDYGVVAKYLTVENQQLLDVQSLNTQFNAEINSNSLNNIYENADNIQQVLKENKIKIQNLEYDVVRYKINVEELWYRGLDDKVMKSNMTDQEKQEFYFAMNLIRSSNIQKIEQVSKSESNLYQVIEQFIDFLSNDQGNFQIKNHQIIFQTQTDYDHFNSFQKQIDDLSKQINLERDNTF